MFQHDAQVLNCRVVDKYTMHPHALQIREFTLILLFEFFKNKAQHKFSNHCLRETVDVKT